MGDREELMTAELCSYLPDPPTIQNYQDLVEFFSNRQTYHTNSVPNEGIRGAFFKTFTKENFRYLNNEDTSGNKMYRLTIFPTEALYTSDKELIASLRETTTLFEKLTNKKGRSIRSSHTSMLLKLIPFR